jgi:hypothetical protein
MSASHNVAASIVVVNLNGARLLPGLLASLAAQTARDFELILVDNGSTDGSLRLVEGTANGLPFPLHVIRNAANAGFGPASNQGLQLASANWIAMLNNDARPEPAWLERLLDTTERMPRLGMVGSKMLRAHRPGEIDTAGIAVDWAGIAWDWRGGAADDPGERDLIEIFGPCGGAALYARAMLDEVGAFDGDFFAYLEDVDLAWRARLAGWQACLQPQARALHAHSATLGDASPRKRFLLGRNKVWLLVKNYPNPWLARYLPLILAYDALAAGYGLATRGDLAAWRGRMAGWAALPRFLAKRRRIQSTWQDVDNWRRAMSPTEPPWAIPRRYAHLRGAPLQPQTGARPL